jgi:hypothetical protein
MGQSTVFQHAGSIPQHSQYEQQGKPVASLPGRVGTLALPNAQGRSNKLLLGGLNQQWLQAAALSCITKATCAVHWKQTTPHDPPMPCHARLAGGASQIPAFFPPCHGNARPCPTSLAN